MHRFRSPHHSAQRNPLLVEVVTLSIVVQRLGVNSVIQGEEMNSWKKRKSIGSF